MVTVFALRPTNKHRTSTTADRGGIRARGLCGAAPYAQRRTASTVALSRTSACRWSEMHTRSCAAVSGHPRRPSHSTNARRLSSCKRRFQVLGAWGGDTSRTATLIYILTSLVQAGTTPHPVLMGLKRAR